MGEPVDHAKRTRGDARSRVLAAAVRLVAAGGPEAATTRAIAEAARVQVPTIYRLFGDKAALLEEVAQKTLSDFVARKASRRPSNDPVSDLRSAWGDYVAFNVANPAVFALTTGAPGSPSAAAAAGLAVLRERVRRVAAAGLLRTSEERAVDLIHAMGAGTIMALLDKPAAEREGLSEAAFEAVLSAVAIRNTAPVTGSAAAYASALRVELEGHSALSEAEQGLLHEWLKRIANQGS